MYINRRYWHTAVYRAGAAVALHALTELNSVNRSNKVHEKNITFDIRALANSEDQKHDRHLRQTV